LHKPLERKKEYAEMKGKNNVTGESNLQRKANRKWKDKFYKDQSQIEKSKDDGKSSQFSNQNDNLTERNLPRIQRHREKLIGKIKLDKSNAV
jgi:hypothetical protein